MILFRCTQRALKRFRLTPESTPPVPTSRLGAWYVNLLNYGAQRLVICLSERTLLPVLLPARNSEFPVRFGQYLLPVLLGIGIPELLAREEAAAATDHIIARTASRQMLGTLNDFSRCATHRMEDRALLETALALAEMPSKSLHYDSPDRVTRGVFGLDPRQSEHAV